MKAQIFFLSFTLATLSPDLSQAQSRVDATTKKAFPKFNLSPISQSRTIAQEATQTDQINQLATQTVSSKTTNLFFKKNSLTLVSFWASWCSPCIKEFSELKKLHTKFAKLGFQVLGINVDDSVQLANSVISKHRPNFPNIYDGDQSLADQLNITVMPHSILVDSRGRIQKRISGYSQKSKKELSKYIQTHLERKPLKKEQYRAVAAE